MGRRLVIFGVLILIFGLCAKPGAAWQEPLKKAAPAAVSAGVQGVAAPEALVSGSVPPAVITRGAASVAEQNAASATPVSEQNAASATSVSEQDAASAAPVAEQDAVRSDAAQQSPDEAPPDDSIYIRHIRTYDLPQNEGDPDKPRKIFVLELQVFYPDCSYSDIILDTNAGFGVMRGVLNSTQATRLRWIELACNPDAGDDCSPEAIVIHNASAALFRYQTQNHERTDILDRLRRNADTFRRVETAKGVLPPSSAASGTDKGNKRQKILIAYEGEYSIHGLTVDVRLTFPPGQKKFYKNPALVTSWGYNSPGSFFEDPRLPDSYVLELSATHLDPMDADYVPIDTGALGYSGVFIRDAYAWKKGKKVNLLPLLAEDPFRRFPIHNPAGLLPLGPLILFNIYWGPENP